ncbi:DUF4912 domain-containing protein [Desulfofundulus thermocisternus]|uniref:DUF4912 domain-containing protein n=1 Tax=Desulfofundulus thermocisternus TaxID=42471 RepID=UPI00048664B3|nr:DUF4912 domain-containing protein [Desulfofundulus thermocisternus]
MELPPCYNENRLVLMVQEPAVIFSYWELSREQWESLRGEQFLFLRLYISASSGESASWREISLPPFTDNWYFRDVLPEQSYYAEIGYYGPEGEFYPLVRSNRVTTPRTRKVAGVARFLKADSPFQLTTGEDGEGVPEEGYSSADLWSRS